MRVLVVEDETKVGSFIKRALEEESYAVDLCEDGAQGLDMALSGSYDDAVAGSRLAVEVIGGPTVEHWS